MGKTYYDTFLKKPSVIWGAFFLSLIIGAFFPSLGSLLKTPSDIYLSVFEMCVIPLLMTSLISSLAYMMSERNQRYNVLNFIVSFLLISLVLAVLAIVFFMIFSPGKSISKDSAFLDIMLSGESAHPLLLGMNETLKQSTNFSDFFKNIFTSNIFYSLYNSIILQIIFFSILIGAAAGCLKEDAKTTFLNFVSSIDDIFKKIIGWIMCLLPIGILCIFSSRFLEVKTAYIKIFIYPIFIILITMIILILISNYLIARRMNMKYMDVISHLKKPLILSVSTNSVIAAMPLYMETLEKHFQMDIEKIKLYVPITLTTFRFGSMYYFCCLTVLATQIFSIPLTFIDYTVLILLTILGGFSAVSSGILNVKILAMIFQPLGIPSGLIVGIFSILDPIFDPIRMVFNFYINLCGILFAMKDVKADCE
jgi:proton glutamate symport protein